MSRKTGSHVSRSVFILNSIDLCTVRTSKETQRCGGFQKGNDDGQKRPEGKASGCKETYFIQDFFKKEAIRKTT